jgi:outer membrane protein OmpA-like peptidoglycan-associated protein
MKVIKSIISVIVIGMLAGSSTFAGYLPDTIVTVSGQVVSSDGNEPIQAIIEYKKLPYGSEIGKISSDENGNFTIYLHGNTKYLFKVSSEGYFAHNEELQIETTQITGKDIELSGGDAGYVFLLKNLNFDINSDQIHAESYNELNILVERLSEYPDMVIQLEGHTDYVGNANSNMELSEKRVQSVKNYLISKNVAKERVLTKAYGGTQPLSREDTPEAHSSNRRVEVRIIKVE